MRTTLAAAAVLLIAGVCARAEDPLNVLSPEEAKDGFTLLFDGKTTNGWQGDTKGYVPEDGKLVCKPGGNLYTLKEYSDFVLRFEFKLPPGGNNGVGIRTPNRGDAAYVGMEIQILDDGHPKYKGIQPYQAHGSIYGVVPAKRGFLKPTGEWNYEEIEAKGSKIKVTLNGTVITDADIGDIKETMDHRQHPGLHNAKGFLAFLGHGDRLEFRNIRVKELK